MNIYITIVIMSITTYLIRMIPFVFFQKKIKSKFLYSFFTYIPYAVLSSMVFPSVLYSTNNIICSAIATVFAIGLSLANLSMFSVSISSAIIVYIAEKIVTMI